MFSYCIGFLLDVFYCVDTLASLSPNNVIRINVINGNLKGLGLLKRYGTAEVFGIVFSTMSFKIDVNKDMGSS